MICLTKVYDDIILDFNQEHYFNSNILSRRLVLKNKLILLVSVYRNENKCEISISIPNNVTAQSFISLPKWKGMEENLLNVLDEETVKQFLSFKQINDFDIKIFLLVMQDLINSVDVCNETNVVNCIKGTLVKWSTFFQLDRNYVLSDNIQQGLYGELFFLEQMLDIKSEKVIDSWTGCNSECHDFYIGKDAVEVKSFSGSGPDKVKISNEFQLDDSGIPGNLYLLFIKMKKSAADGESLPDIVGRISKKIGQASRLAFFDKLLKVGYLYQMPELYTLHFRVREEDCYIVQEGFPRITSKTIVRGIGSVSYTVSLDACDSFQIIMESFFKGVDL